VLRIRSTATVAKETDFAALLETFNDPDTHLINHFGAGFFKLGHRHGVLSKGLVDQFTG